MKPFEMANTYTQLHIQLVFAVKYRLELIQPLWKEELHKYMTALIQQHDHKMLQINSMPDQINIFIGLRPTEDITDLIQHVKSESTKWIKANRLSPSFAWQEGFGAFSYSRSHVNNVIQYIQNQEAHHKKETFLDEYKRMLTAFDIEYDESYIFKEPA
ncbi:MAG: transposase IS200-family protein [Segetibacter sp.]|nr:transposase IS200-family protein [Segetibacter sp.]